MHLDKVPDLMTFELLETGLTLQSGKLYACSCAAKGTYALQCWVPGATIKGRTVRPAMYSVGVASPPPGVP